MTTDPRANNTAESENTNQYKIKLEVFEGPLDLLLYLIKKEEIDIYDIPIAGITEQYLEYIRLMQELDIDLAGEFLVMAATLIHIKSKLLLPPPADENGDPESLIDPRDELVHRLLEHKKFKAAAEMLWSRAEVEQATFTRAELETDKDNPEVAATLLDLVEVFKKILERRREQVEVEIAQDEITMAKKIAEIEALFDHQTEISINKLIEEARSRREMVIIFLAVLELVKVARMFLTQTETFGEIRAIRREEKAENHAGHEEHEV